MFVVFVFFNSYFNPLHFLFQPYCSPSFPFPCPRSNLLCLCCFLNPVFPKASNFRNYSFTFHLLHVYISLECMVLFVSNKHVFLFSDMFFDVTFMDFGRQGLGFRGIKVRNLLECFYFISDYLQEGFKAQYFTSNDWKFE